MYKLSSLLILIIYFLPFSVAMKSVYFFEFLQVLIILSAFFLGGLLSTPFLNKNTLQDYSSFYIPRINVLIVILIAYLAFRGGEIIEVLSHLHRGDYAEWTLSNAIKRYEGEYDLGITQKIGTVFFFTYAFLLGAYRFRKKYLYLALAFIFMILIESSGLARAGVLLAATALVVELMIRFNTKLSNMKFTSYIKYAVLAVSTLLLIFGFSAYFRIAGKEDIINTLFDKLLIYTIAMYQALYIWMGSNDYNATTYGFSTFTAIFKLLGESALQGFYTPVNTEYGWTNVFTNIRGLLSDFGFFLTVVIYGSIGFTIKLCAYTRMGPLSYFLVRFMLYFILFILVSPFSFSTVLVSFVFSWLLIIIFREKNVLLYQR
jgi:oligosaccharide repeat unit polymerase